MITTSELPQPGWFIGATMHAQPGDYVECAPGEYRQIPRNSVYNNVRPSVLKTDLSAGTPQPSKVWRHGQRSYSHPGGAGSRTITAVAAAELVADLI